MQDHAGTSSGGDPRQQRHRSRWNSAGMGFKVLPQHVETTIGFCAPGVGAGEGSPNMSVYMPGKISPAHFTATDCQVIGVEKPTAGDF